LCVRADGEQSDPVESAFEGLGCEEVADRRGALDAGVLGRQREQRVVDE